MSRRRDPHRRQALDLNATRDLVEEVLRTAMVLEDVIDSLLDDLPASAFPGEDPGLVLLEMAIGSAHPATTAAGPAATRTATALIGAIRQRILTDLHTAASLAPDRDPDPDPPARNPEK
jgi:hypothetical protein